MNPLDNVPVSNEIIDAPDVLISNQTFGISSNKEKESSSFNLLHDAMKTEDAKEENS